MPTNASRAVEGLYGIVAAARATVYQRKIIADSRGIDSVLTIQEVTDIHGSESYNSILGPREADRVTSQKAHLVARG